MDRVAGESLEQAAWALAAQTRHRTSFSPMYKHGNHRHDEEAAIYCPDDEAISAGRLPLVICCRNLSRVFPFPNKTAYQIEVQRRPFRACEVPSHIQTACHVQSNSHMRCSRANHVAMSRFGKERATCHHSWGSGPVCEARTWLDL